MQLHSFTRANRILSLLIILVMLISLFILSGCTPQTNPEESGTPSQESRAVSEDSTASEPVEPDESAASEPSEVSEDSLTSEEPSEAESDSEPPVFTDAVDGVLPELTHEAGGHATLTNVRVEDNETASDKITVSITDDGGYKSDVPGTYTIRYRAEDEAGNAAEATRTVVVTARTETSDVPSETSPDPAQQGKDDPVNEDADVMIVSKTTPFVFNEEGALKYTSSGTSFRTKDVIQIMDSDFFLSQYEEFASGHTNNGGVPYFPNGVLILADKDYKIREVRIAAGELFQIDEKGHVSSDNIKWTNALDASAGGGLFKGIRSEIDSVLPKGGYLLFCGNIGEQKCRVFFIRQLLVSDYSSGAVAASQINVKEKQRTVGWKDDGGSSQGSSSQGSGKDPAVVKKTVLTPDEVVAGLPVHTGKISGEASKPQAPDVFKGAWYRKAVSSQDAWAGIEATVTLPTFHIRRYNGSYDASLDADPNAKNLDTPSVYLGGKSKYESDIGLSLSLGLVKNASGSTSVSKGSVCFRPFWRYITKDNQDAGGYDVHGGKYAVTANGNNCIGNYHYSYTEYYYLPGDTLRIMVFSPAENKLQFAIKVISASTLESSVAMREKNGWKQPADFLSPVFHSDGYGTGIDTEYKRVCAIDQSGNEGKEAIATASEVLGIEWKEVYLYRFVDGKAVRVPMTENRYAIRNAPDDKHVTVFQDKSMASVGGEKVDIHPGRTS